MHSKFSILYVRVTCYFYINIVNIIIVLPEFFSSSFELVDNFAFGGDSFHRNDLPRCGWVASVIENVIIVTKLTNIFYQLIIAIYIPGTCQGYTKCNNIGLAFSMIMVIRFLQYSGICGFR